MRNSTPGMPKLPATKTFRMDSEREKSKNPPTKSTRIKIKKPETAFSKSLKASFIGADSIFNSMKIPSTTAAPVSIIERVSITCFLSGNNLQYYFLFFADNISGRNALENSGTHRQKRISLLRDTTKRAICQAEQGNLYRDRFPRSGLHICSSLFLLKKTIYVV